MKNLNYILAGILIVAIAIFLVLLIKPTTEINYSGNNTGTINYIENLEQVNYIIENGTAYINDENIYLSATPNAGIGWITYELETKDYTGDIDAVFLFDSELAYPTRAKLKRDSPIYVNNSYTCDYEFTYNNTDKTFHCYKSYNYNDSLTNESYVINQTMKKGNYDSGNIQTKTVYWTKEDWYNNVGNAFTKYNINYSGMDLAYVTTGFPVEAGVREELNVFLQPTYVNSPGGKYWFCTKPSGYSINEAIDSGYLYCLDPFWTEELNDAIISYWRIDNNNTDSADGNDATITGMLFNNSEFILGGFSGFFDASADRFDTNFEVANFRTEGTVSFWVFTLDNTANAVVYSNIGGGAFKMWENIGSGNLFTAELHDGATKRVSEISGHDDSTWYNLVVTWDSTTLQLWKNAVFQGSTPAGAINAAFDNFDLQFGGDADDYFGNIDEIAIYSIRIANTTIAALYGGGTPPSFGNFSPDNPPNVSLNNPANFTNFTLSNNVDLNCTAFDDFKVQNISLYINGSRNATDTSGTNNTLINFNLNLDNGLWNWTCDAWDNASQQTNASEVRLLFFNVTQAVGIDLITPIDDAKVTDTTIFFSYNLTAKLTNITNHTHYIWFNNGTNFLTNTTALPGGTNETVTIQNFQPNLLDNIYNWTVKVCGNGVDCIMASNRTFQTHTGIPSVEILFPTGNLGAVIDGASIFLNWSISETGITNFSEHVSNCSFLYNGVTEFLDNVSECVEKNFTIFNYVSGINTINFTTVDIFNFSFSNTSSWVVSISEVNQTFNNETIEGNQESFTIFVVTDPSFQITAAQLTYNGSATAGILTNPTTNLFKATTDFIVPETSVDVNVSFFWTFALNDSTNVNGLTKNQTIKNLAIDDCSSFTGLFLNLTLIDEEFQNQLNETEDNTTIEVDITIESFDNSIVVANFSQTFNETNPVSICLNINLTNENKYSYDTTIRYDGDPYSNEFYHIQRGNLTNGTIPNNISLFDLLSADATEFQITFKDSSFVVVEDAIIIISREYVGEGLFKTVEIPKTDSNGQTVAHLVEKDVKYNMLVIKNGVILGTFNNLIAFCEDETIGSCFITLNALGSNTPIFNYNETFGIAFPPMTYNSTSRALTFTFSTIDGTIKTINLTAVKMDQIGNNTACDEVLTSSSGTITCIVPTAIGNATIFVNIFVNNELKLVDYIITGKNLDSGDFGYFLFIIMVLSFALMLSSTKTGMIIGVIIGFISSTLFGFIEGGIIGFGSATMWLIISGIILIWGLNTKSQS